MHNLSMQEQNSVPSPPPLQTLPLSSQLEGSKCNFERQKEEPEGEREVKNPVNKGHSLNIGLYSKKLHFLSHHLPQHPVSQSHLSSWILTCGQTLSSRVLPDCASPSKGSCVIPQYFWKGALWLQDCSPLLSAAGCCSAQKGSCQEKINSSYPALRHRHQKERDKLLLQGQR